MFGKSAMRYPMLVTGIIMFSIFILDSNTQNWWTSFQARYIPNTCRSLKDRVQSKLPKNWTIDCPGTSRLIISYEFDPSIDGIKKENARVLVYRDLANSLQKFSRVANPETLISLKVFEMSIVHKKLEVIAKTDGQALVKLAELTGQDEIAKHLHLTVRTSQRTIDN